MVGTVCRPASLRVAVWSKLGRPLPTVGPANPCTRGSQGRWHTPRVLPVVSKPATDVVILGAGFSKALAEAMPLTDELGEDVLEKVVQGSALRLPERFSGGQFEAWLSRIAEDQPDLSVADNLANRALFQRCSEALASVLNDHADSATEELGVDTSKQLSPRGAW
jgi:hypothetical protein